MNDHDGQARNVAHQARDEAAKAHARINELEKRVKEFEEFRAVLTEGIKSISGIIKEEMQEHGAVHLFGGGNIHLDGNENE